jgi:hypothetical protein
MKFTRPLHSTIRGDLYGITGWFISGVVKNLVKELKDKAFKTLCLIKI